jgi:hypothetical protein
MKFKSLLESFEIVKNKFKLIEGDKYLIIKNKDSIPNLVKVETDHACTLLETQVFWIHYSQNPQFFPHTIKLFNEYNKLYNITLEQIINSKRIREEISSYFNSSNRGINPKFSYNDIMYEIYEYKPLGAVRLYIEKTESSAKRFTNYPLQITAETSSVRSFNEKHFPVVFLDTLKTTDKIVCAFFNDETEKTAYIFWNGDKFIQGT